MFSTGHLLWIGISFCLIVGGVAACFRIKPDENRLVKVCLGLGILSETVKVLSVMRILPMVDIAVDGAQLSYPYAGQYTPYLEMADLPLELCSLQIVFMAALLLSKTPLRRSRLRALMFVTGVIGGLMGIVMAQVTVDYHTVKQYFASPRIYQYFLYHSMVVALGLYLGLGPDSDVSLRRFKETMGLLLLMDVPTFYLNSVFSQPVYDAGKPVGIVYRTNFFSSYVNPLGLVLTQRWQWIAYLVLRLGLAAALTALLLLLADRTARRRNKKQLTKDHSRYDPGHARAGR
ncbi:MAG: YwaF family protein [Clostridia bacterium]|nr:YwaF family protein [Clostridia bacterium]